MLLWALTIDSRLVVDVGVKTKRGKPHRLAPFVRCNDAVSFSS
jgi:hypothetical protein